MTYAIPFTKFHIRADVHRNICMALCVIMVLSVAMIVNTQVAFCTEPPTTPTDPVGIDKIGEIGTVVASSFYQLIRSVVTPFVIIAFAVAGLQFFIGGNQGTETAKKIVFGACAGLILVVFAPVLGNFLAEQFASYGGGNLSDFNPLD